MVPVTFHLRHRPRALHQLDRFGQGIDKLWIFRQRTTHRVDQFELLGGCVSQLVGKERMQ